MTGFTLVWVALRDVTMGFGMVCGECSCAGFAAVAVSLPSHRLKFLSSWKFLWISHVFDGHRTKVFVPLRVTARQI